MFPKIIERRRSSSNEKKVLNFLNEHPDGCYSTSELGKLLGGKGVISEGTVYRIVTKLSQIGLVKRYPTLGGHILYSLNKDDDRFYLIWPERESVQLSCDPRVTELIKELGYDNNARVISFELSVYLKCGE